MILDWIPLGDFGKQVKRAVVIDSNSTYRTLGCRLYGKGVYNRETKRGSEIKAKRMFLVNEGDLVINRIWAHKGSAGIIPKEIAGSVVTTDFPVFELDMEKVHPEYIGWYLRTNDFQNECLKYSHGTSGRRRLNPSQAINLAFPICDPELQVKISKNLESFFSQTEEIERNAKHIKELTPMLQNAILADAFRGRLTSRGAVETDGRALLKQIERRRKTIWADEIIKQRQDPEKKTYSPPATPQNGKPEWLPESWGWASLDEICEKIVDCLHSTPKFWNDGKYCIDTTCIIDGKILFEKMRHVSEDTYNKRIRRLEPRWGDIVFAREATVGTAVVVPKNVELCLGQRVMLFRPFLEINSEYLMWAINSPIIRNQIQPLLVGSTVPHLNVRDARRLGIPIAPKEEQVQIITKLTDLILQSQMLQRFTATSFLQITQLEQSILTNAFKGELVL